MLEVIAAAVGAFAGTNVDDVILLTVLFTASQTTGQPLKRQIWAGQFAGISLLVAAAVVAALGLTIVPDKWVGILGLVPMALGVRGLGETIESRRTGAEPETPALATGVVSVMSVTLANGADNIAIYTPMFRSLDAPDTLVTIAVFLVMVAIWCAAGMLLGAHRHVTGFIERWGHWVVPAVFISIGTFIVLESHLLQNVADLI